MIVPVGLVQMRCGEDRDANLAKAVGADRGGGAARRRASSACRSSSARPTSARARTRRASTWPSRFPGPTTEALGKVAAARGVAIVGVALRAARRGPLPQHRGRARRRRPHRAALPQDAHPRRPALLREVLLHARRPRLPRVRRARRAGRRRSSAGTSGSPRPRGSPRSRGAQILFYPTAIGWQFDEGAGGGRGAARRLGDRCSAARDRERRVRRRGEPRRARGRRPLLGPVLRRRSLRPRARARVGRRDEEMLRRRVRPRADRARCAATGRSCATAASTPTRTSLKPLPRLSER